MPELKDYQRAGVEFIKDNYQILLADEMGLGKTATALKGIEDRLQEERQLVVCPASLKYNWCEEIKIWLGLDVEPDNLTDFPIAVTNYERLKDSFAEIKAQHFGGVIFDEAHYMKNKDSIRSIYGRKVGWMYPYVLLLTGTPMVSGPVDLAPLLDCLGLIDEFGGYFKFYQRYCDPLKTRYGWDYSGSSYKSELKRKLKPFLLRRTKKEVGIKLPPKNIVKVPVCRLNQDFASDFSTMERNQRFVNEVKLSFALGFLDNLLMQGKRPVVFVHHRDLMEELMDRYKDIAVNVVGGQSMDKRNKNVHDFQNLKKNMIVCSLQASAVGLTLTSSDTAVFLEYLWSPSVLQQAMDRVHRITQGNPVTIYELYCKGSIEDQKDFTSFCKEVEMRGIL